MADEAAGGCTGGAHESKEQYRPLGRQRCQLKRKKIEMKRKDKTSFDKEPHFVLYRTFHNDKLSDMCCPVCSGRAGLRIAGRRVVARTFSG